TGSVILNERNFDAGSSDRPSACPLLPGICIDIDCKPDNTRLRGQIQLGCFMLRLDHAGGHGSFELSIVLPDTTDPHAEQLDHNEHILRWIEEMNAGCLGGAAPEPPLE